MAIRRSRAIRSSGDSGEEGLIIAVAGEESIARGVALVRVGSGWELQLRDGATVSTGFTDRYAWLEEGAEAPLLLDEAYAPKPAFFAVQQRLAE